MRAAVFLLAAVLVACGSTAPAAPRVELSYVHGAVVGGVTRHAVPLGSTVELVVASDVTDEVSVRGYERSGYVTGGASTTLRFVADRPGLFEVELVQRMVPLGQLDVG
jgi:hypothetical protein